MCQRVGDHQDKVLEVCLSSDRVMAVKLVLSAMYGPLLAPMPRK